VEVNKKGIYFAFRDEGACISLLAIKVLLLLYLRHGPK
jgi:predicted DNA-binding helix-hairpin-helix protein